MLPKYALQAQGLARSRGFGSNGDLRSWLRNWERAPTGPPGRTLFIRSATGLPTELLTKAGCARLSGVCQFPERPGHEGANDAGSVAGRLGDRLSRSRPSKASRAQPVYHPSLSGCDGHIAPGLSRPDHGAPSADALYRRFAVKRWILAQASSRMAFEVA